MTPLNLQDSLKMELEKVLANVLLKSSEAFHFYTQNLPPKKDSQDKSMFPYCLIKLGDGEDDQETSTQDVIIVFATWDKDKDYQGYRDVMNAIQIVREYLKKNQEIDDTFSIKYPVRWASPDDSDTYPFYFGAILVTFSLPQIGLVSENL